MANKDCNNPAISINIPDDRMGLGFTNYFSDNPNPSEDTGQNIDYSFTEYTEDNTLTPPSMSEIRIVSSEPEDISLAHEHHAGNDTNAETIQKLIDAQAVIMNEEPDVPNTLLGNLDVGYLIGNKEGSITEEEVKK